MFYANHTIRANDIGAGDIPHFIMPGYTRRSVRAAKAGVDANNKLLTIVSRDINGPTVAGKNFISYYYNALNKLYTSQSFGSYKGMYKEYRIKQVKIHAYLRSVKSDGPFAWDNKTPMNVSYCWGERSSVFSNVTPLDPGAIDAAPDAVQKIWPLSTNNPEFWSTCTSAGTGGEGNWISTTSAPGTSPNTGMYFSPAFSMAVTLPDNSTGNTGYVNFTFETEYIIEFRGAKQ